MVIKELIKQEWKKGFRSQAFYKSLAVKILLGFMVLYFAVTFFMLGLFLGDILDEVNDTLTPLEVLNGVSVYLILGGIIIRMIMQALKTLDLQTYQVMPIKRNTLVHFILLRPIFALINYAVLILLIPFAFKSIVAYYSTGVALHFLAIWILIILFDLWLASYLKRKFNSSLIAFITGLILIGGLILLEYYHIFSLFDISKNIFNFLTIQNPIGWMIVLVLVALVYLLNYAFFSKHYYLEGIANKSEKGSEKVTSGLNFLEKYGIFGEIIRNQIRLILRHKRTKSTLYVSIIFLLYGLLFYINPIYKDNASMLFFCAIFVTGVPMLMFGQWVYSWESNYFDALMTKSISIKDYVRANYFFLLALSVVSFLITTLYFFFGIEIVYLHIAAIFYNVGISIPFLLFFGTYNIKKIDLKAGTAFNYQGTTYKSFLMMIPILGLPMVILGFLNLFLESRTSLMIIAGMGFISLVFTKQILNLCIKQFKNRKYAMAEGFREKE